ncbi:carbamoyltransferase [Thiohalorhabdus denitrificans]|uniref:Carbamoyltransferase HypF n=1 Tax=Thiohalorhabdus denitrificans TaxID=381306 RepID=A0A0P9C576_9GAMM|nr:carbamoyltransferase HypF [Thiohalorhabdus denitrificans]KPV40001.1 carbamoyltransferase [Thiohalorhabdus denitrificans]SCY11678.1 hydrogenase maturation protein HypF [Thiohalorhabdus denitrificans]
MGRPATAAVGGERIRVRGLVQGVGFRPTVWRLAREEGLTGEVGNDGAGLWIRIWGPEAVRARFRERLRAEAPPLARIEALEVESLGSGPAPARFSIASSGGGTARTGVASDAPVCPACLAELLDPGDRRYRYPFLNCTHCGPRYTITTAIPYDRPNTTLAGFPLCGDCSREYADPGDRRFHAQPIACPACGPALVLRDSEGRPEAGDPVSGALAHIRAGRIVAMKGVGGYHLACDARDPGAVPRLRARKERGGKPLAVMAANPASLERWARIGPAERDLLGDPARPIALLAKRGRAEAELPGIAPGLAEVGAMLPYAPIHYLLFHEAAGRPAGTGWLGEPQGLLLVMTSANPGGEPLVTEPDEAHRRLAGIADAFLDHDRPIAVACDDSVARLRSDGRRLLLRRGRGHAPRAVPLPRKGAPVLATGAWLKNTVCLTRGDEAHLSQHIGDLANPAAVRAMEGAAAHLEALLETAPGAVACDLHPDFPSTHLAHRLAEVRGLPVVPVQHHHAHIAAVAAEHRLGGPVLGLALDGVGLGDDRAAWGGEMLVVDGARYERLGHLTPLPLPGGDRAAREPWRMAAAALHLLGRGAEIETRFGHREGAGLLARMLEREAACPWTTSAGRWFDAAAGLLGVREVCGYEAQAAMELEGLARAQPEPVEEPGGFRVAGPELDPTPLLEALLEEPDPARGAARFHAGLAAGLAEWARWAAAARGLTRVVLGGGCWANTLLAGKVRRRLEASGLTVFEAEAVPPGDGGLSLGQAWVAVRSLEED